MAIAPATDKTAAQLLGVTPYEDKKVTSTSAKTSTNMGKQDFLTLFTAQLQNQNPLEPVKNEAFVAQLAQFSQLEALNNMQGSLDTFVKAMSGQRMLEGAALIGKQVPLADGTARLVEGGSVPATIDLPDGASGVKVTIKDSSGNTVQELIAGEQNPGALDFTWDGKNSAGAAAPTGTYKMTATAVVGGATKNVGVQTLATIRSVTTDASTHDVKLELAGGQSVLLSTVKRIVN
jgi:flagellar basal-body rod modification protein FlgD